jgi:hypothetical protein
VSADKSQTEGESGGRIPYTHRSSSREQRRLERRTAANAAGFFLPHLRPDMRLLDCGCGIGSITIGLVEAVAPGIEAGRRIRVGGVKKGDADAIA